MMIKVGKLTGSIYHEGTDESTIEECCFNCNEDEVEETIQKVNDRTNKLECMLCGGCPMSIKNIKRYEL